MDDFETRPALVLDLDGTVRYSKNGDFIEKIEDIALYPDVEKKLWEYKHRGYLILGATNQGGVAFGHKTPEQVHLENAHTMTLFHDNPIDVIKSCFSHYRGSVPPWNVRSLLRKPDYGMLVMLEGDCFDAGFLIDWDKSIFVGDREEDEQCAKSAGIAFQWARDFFEREFDGKR